MKRELIKALSAFTQLGLSVVVSFLLWILIAMWLKKTFSLGNGIMVVGVILGAGSGFLSFIKGIKELENSDPKEKNK
ncbi:MAG: AtpZ/AtpI family protein [Clostridia bacterium]|nr:AtpZ/AtpI family protein [Clostridia bacterium]